MMLRKFSTAAAILAYRINVDAFSTSPSRSALALARRWLSLQSTTDNNLEGSLVSQTLEKMESDEEFQEISRRIQRIGADGMTREERFKRRRALTELGVPNFMQFVTEKNVDDTADGAIQNMQLYRSQPTILQLNIGLYCNQACSHCHVESSPLRKKETMSSEIAALCLKLLHNSPDVDTLDLTGGAPELNEQFRFLVSLARQWSIENKRQLTIIDRCNLTVLLEPDQTDLVDFLKEHQVKVVASLPCYGKDNVDAQRGRGVFDRSIAALLKLNAAGYGTPEHPELELDLVYNPSGPFLPPSQETLSLAYKRELMKDFGIQFNNLLTITNMPVSVPYCICCFLPLSHDHTSRIGALFDFQIKRFADYLAKQGKMKDYMELLVNNYNSQTVKGLMCRNTVSVGWDGAIYDCDFNQQLGMQIVGEIHSSEITSTTKQKLSVFDIQSLTDLQKHSIRTDNHCFGCTAGSG